MASFVVDVFGLVLSTKICPDQPRAFKKVSNGQVFL